MSNLLEYVSDINEELEKQNEIHAIYTDFSKAFDMVDFWPSCPKVVPRRTPSETRQDIVIGDKTFAAVHDFVYLGSLISDQNEISAEICKRIMAANKCYFGLLRYFRSKLLSRNIKVLLYKTLLRPVLTYGSESWVLSKKDEDCLLVFERKILRRIFGAVLENRRWRTRYNHELYGMYKEPNVIKTIKLGRLRWAGHVARMDDNRAPLRLLDGKPDGRRNRGRPKLRWLDGVEQDLKTIDVKNWRTRAKDRDVWKKILDQAKAHSRL
ncbi:uncharacterized protein LOC123691743 [Colias croceus]|uniref:uncharacterized protein LOC123691743 n=1 Tax=Colias crocea TaxID=72248 RepID=UPI001E27B386|nr:uncharacterized protein LOC123691743 [Colias croceus]